jgi:hypothetical protein
MPERHEGTEPGASAVLGDGDGCLISVCPSSQSWPSAR